MQATLKSRNEDTGLTRTGFPGTAPDLRYRQSTQGNFIDTGNLEVSRA